mmetsp:Transcript_9762/g.17811  ORF Transcript_9762/g.17811 Transcript_9762/m.17811 type:complete len:400 (+) Transcript_9762:74-1273(+)
MVMVYRYILWLCFCFLGSSGEANTCVFGIEHSVVFTKEDVSEDVELLLSEHGETHKSADALSRHLNDVVLWFEREVLAFELDVDSWHSGQLGAIDGELLSHRHLSGTDGFVQFLDHVGRTSDERSSGVGNGVDVLFLHISNLKRFDLKLPVGLGAQRDVCEVSSVVLRVSAANDHFALLLLGLRAKVESEDLLGALVEKVVPDGLDAIDRDRLPGHSHDSVELSDLERHTGLVGSLSEGGTLDSLGSDSDVVLREEARERAAAVADGELGSVLLVSGGLGVVVALVEVPRAALILGRNPKVGRTGVEHDVECLRRRADLDFAVVLGVHEVRDGDWVAGGVGGGHVEWERSEAVAGLADLLAGSLFDLFHRHAHNGRGEGSGEEERELHGGGAGVCLRGA